MNVRLAYTSAAVLGLVGVVFLLRADERVQTTVGWALLLSAIALAVGTWSAEKQQPRRQVRTRRSGPHRAFPGFRPGLDELSPGREGCLRTDPRSVRRPVGQRVSPSRPPTVDALAFR
jgi:hypothetical protein